MRILNVALFQDEHNEASSQQTQRMAQLHGEWLADLQRLGEFHQQAIEVLRSEQTSAIEHWKDLQAAEKAAIKEASTHARYKLVRVIVIACWKLFHNCNCQFTFIHICV